MTDQPENAREEVAAILEGAADLIEPEGAWTQGVFARLDNGSPTGLSNPFAYCFCLRGALVKVGALRAYDENTPIAKRLGFDTASAMTRWNDAPERTQAEVVAKLREAAAKARAQVSA